ncbi:MAG: DNA methyltransferase [Planctomycetota bacterium]
MAKKSPKKKTKAAQPKHADALLGKIHQGDCMDCFREVPDGSIDLVFADPPFNIGYEYDEYEDKLDSEKYVDWCSAWMRESHRILKSNGTFWLAIGDDYAAELKIAAQQAGFHTRNWVIWYYTFGVHCKSKFTRSHTHLFYFIKDPKDFTFNFDDVAVPSARQLVYNDKRANSAGRSPDDTWILRPQDCDGFGMDEDTWYFPRVAGTFKERAGFHGCQMPEQLLGRIIRACSDEGEIVLDPFTGSATTLAVAKKLKRNFLGFELSKEYAKFGRKRLKEAKIGDPLSGTAEPQKSAPKTRKKATTKASPQRSNGRKVDALGQSSPQLAFKLTESKSVSKKRAKPKTTSAKKKTSSSKKTKSKRRSKSLK